MSTINRLLLGLFFSAITLNSYSAQDSHVSKKRKQPALAEEEASKEEDSNKKAKVESFSSSSSSNATPMDTAEDELKSNQEAEFIKAIVDKNLDVIQEILNKNPHFIDLQDHKFLNTALMQATYAGDSEAVQFLIQASANPYVKNKQDETAKDISDCFIDGYVSCGLVGEDDHTRYTAIKDMLTVHAKKSYPQKLNKAIGEGIPEFFSPPIIKIIEQYLTSEETLPAWKRDEIPRDGERLRAHYGSMNQGLTDRPLRSVAVL